MKRIAVLCNDTRGGVQPYVALALGLKRAGHDVRAIAPANLSRMFSDVGIVASSLTGDIEEWMRLNMGAAEGGSMRAMRVAARELPRYLHTWMRETLELCAGADVMTGGVGGMAMGLAVAEKLGRPFVQTHLQPVAAPTARYQGVMFGGTPWWLGGFGRLLSHHLSELAIWLPFRRSMQTARRTALGLNGPLPKRRGAKVLYGFSRHVVDLQGPDRHVTGYWTLPAPTDWLPSERLSQFLAKGGDVVSIGFGSMASRSPEELTGIVTAAVRQAGVRAILLSGWGGLNPPDDSEDLFCAESLPHDWLFPRMAAVVHHGGAGTTGAALRAGVPAIVVPFAVDQPFWASRVHALGAGPRPIPRARLTVDRLAQALKEAQSPSMRSTAATLGEKLRAEDGVANAVLHFTR